MILTPADDCHTQPSPKFCDIMTCALGVSSIYIEHGGKCFCTKPPSQAVLVDKSYYYVFRIKAFKKGF